MKILLVNPNITEAVTEVMAAEARRSASPGVEIDSATAAFGAQYIETRVEAAIASHALLDVFAADVAVGMTNLMYVLDPARIVLGGGLVDIGEPLRARVQHWVDETTLGGAFRPHVPVALAELGSRSAALGAAMLASQLLI